MFTMNSGREVSPKSANNHVMKAFLFYFCFHNFQWSTFKFQGPGGLQWHMKNPVLQDTHTRKLSRIFSDSSLRFSMSSLSSSSSRWAMSHFCSAFNFKCLWGGKFVTYKNYFVFQTLFIKSSKQLLTQLTKDQKHSNKSLKRSLCYGLEGNSVQIDFKLCWFVSFFFFKNHNNVLQTKWNKN